MWSEGRAHAAGNRCARHASELNSCAAELKAGRGGEALRGDGDDDGARMVVAMELGSRVMVNGAMAMAMVGANGGRSAGAHGERGRIRRAHVVQ